MVTPKTASRLSGITVAVGLGVAVTTGHGVASADSTGEGDAPNTPTTSAPPETGQEPSTNADSGGTTATTAAKRTAQQRRAEVREALRDQLSLSPRRSHSESANEESNISVDAASSVRRAVEQSNNNSNAIARRVVQHVANLSKPKMPEQDVEKLTQPAVAPGSAPRPQLFTLGVRPAQTSAPASAALRPLASRALPLSPSVAVAAPRLPLPTPVRVERQVSVLGGLLTGIGLRPNATMPVAPRVPALPRLLELAYAAWRRVVVRRVFNSTPTATVAVDYDNRDTATGELSGAVKGADADNDRLTYKVVRPPATGTLDFHDDGTFTYKPDQDLAHQPNPDDVTFTVQVSDESSRPHLHLLSRTQHATTATVTIDVDQLNQAPTIAVKSREPQGDGSTRFTVETDDPDDADVSSLKVTWTEPTKGSVAPVAGMTNVYAYTPTDPHALQAPTTDTFHFVVTDQYGRTGQSDDVEVTVQPVNSAPTLTVGTPQKQSNGSYTIALSATDDDADAVRVTPPAVTSDVGTWQGLDADGTITLTKANPSRTITFVPKPVTQSTLLTFGFTADDGHYLGTDTESTSLRLEPNRAPSFVIINVSQPDSTTGKVTIGYSKSDPDGDRVTLSATGMDPNATFVDNGDGTATYTPDRSIVVGLGANGTHTDTFTIVASDGRGESVSKAVSATVKFTNQAPYAQFQEARVVNEATGEIEGKVTIVDPDGDPARFTFAATDPSAPASATPGTLTFNPNTGIYTFIPKEAVRIAQPGQYRILIVSVEDGYGGVTNTGAAVLYIVPMPAPVNM